MALTCHDGSEKGGASAGRQPYNHSPRVCVLHSSGCSGSDDRADDQHCHGSSPHQQAPSNSSLCQVRPCPHAYGYTGGNGRCKDTFRCPQGARRRVFGGAETSVRSGPGMLALRGRRVPVHAVRWLAALARFPPEKCQLLYESSDWQQRCPEHPARQPCYTWLLWASLVLDGSARPCLRLSATPAPLVKSKDVVWRRFVLGRR